MACYHPAFPLILPHIISMLHILVMQFVEKQKQLIFKYLCSEIWQL